MCGGYRTKAFLSPLFSLYFPLLGFTRMGLAF
jgi:hypothetical protein